MCYFRVLCLVTCSVSVCPGVARSGEYTDPSGFSFTHPDDWIALTGSTFHELASKLPPSARQVIEEKSVDFTEVSVMVTRVGDEAFLENMNVVVTDEQLPINQATLAQARQEFVRQLQRSGVSVSQFNAEIRSIGGRDVFAINQQVLYAGLPDTIRQRQVYFAGGGKTYIVTCTAMASSFAKYESTFEDTLASFKIPSSGFLNLSPTMRSAILGGIVSVVGGGVFWLVRKLNQRREPDVIDNQWPGSTPS